MANQFFTGFEGITVAQLARRCSLASSALAVAAAWGRFGQGAYLSGGAVAVPVTGSVAQCIIGFASFYITTATSRLAYFAGSSGRHVSLWYNHTLARYEVRGPDDTTVLLATANGFATLNVWRYLELRAVISDTVGVVELRVDGAVIGTATALDTKNAASAIIDEACLSSTGGIGYVDDWYINDTTGSAPHNTFYGDFRVDFTPLVADGSVTDFVPLSSTNKSNVDDGHTPDDDVSHNSSDTPGDKDLFTVGGYTALTGTILGVAVRAVARKTDAGARTFRPLLKSGATTENGPTSALSTTYQEFSHYVYEDPDTSAPFLDDDAVNALEIGYEVVA
jgi:hypothetical protein